MICARRPTFFYSIARYRSLCRKNLD